MKKALLVTLCKMVIDVDKVKKIENGEKILATADDLEVVIKLKRITSKVTRIEIKAGLSPGQLVVVRGNERLRPGQPVKPKHVSAAPQSKQG